MTDPRPQLMAMAERGYGLPAARDHAQIMLRIAERRAVEREQYTDTTRVDANRTDATRGDATRADAIRNVLPTETRQ